MKKNPWLSVIIVSLAILILTSIPKIPTPEKKIHFVDKIAHFLIYFLWGYTLTIVWRVKTFRTKFFISSIITLIILFPAFDELHQYLIPSRNPSFLDWLCDIAGAIAGFCMFARKKLKVKLPVASHGTSLRRRVNTNIGIASHKHSKP